MKAMSSALRNLLATSEYVKADCWTITLNGGAIVRWTSADQPVIANGNLFAMGPLLKRGPISERRGVEVSTLDLEITAIAGRDAINGQPIIPFIAAHGLDGAMVMLERAYAPDWPYLFTIGAIGTLIRFAGKATSIPQIQGATAKLTFSSKLILLNSMMPRNLYQAACMHTLYDGGCGLNPASWQASGHVVGSGATLNFATSLSPAANYYALGRIVFTSGANNGISRTIRASDASGNLTLIRPLPNPLANGDTFLAFPGCDLTTGANGCAKFSNLPNFKGTPFVPLPQTPLGSQSTTTTTRSGK